MSEDGYVRQLCVAESLQRRDEVRSGRVHGRSQRFATAGGFLSRQDVRRFLTKVLPYAILYMNAGRDISPILFRRIARDIGMTAEDLIGHRRSDLDRTRWCTEQPARLTVSSKPT